MRAIAVRGRGLFEFQHVSAKNKLLICKDILNDRHNFSRQRLVLSPEIQQWHGQVRRWSGGFCML